jgi:hypothetical protein
MKTLTKSEAGYVVEMTSQEYKTLYALQEAIKGLGEPGYGYVFAEYREINSDMPETFAAIQRWVVNKFNVNAIENSMKDARKALGE